MILIIVLVLIVVGILLSVPGVLFLNCVWMCAISFGTAGIVCKVLLLLIAFAVLLRPLSVNAITHLTFFIIK